MSLALVFRIHKVVVWSAIFGGSWNLFCQSNSGTAETPGADGSTYTPHMAFDVASIRESLEGNWSYIDNPPKTSSFHAERVAAAGFISGAYDLKMLQQLKGLPDWAWTVRYTVSAKSDSAADEAMQKLSDSDCYAEKRHMLQLLLAERFHLNIHPETRISTTYELVTTGRAAKLMKPVEGEVGETVGTCTPHYSKKGIEVNSQGCPFPIMLSNLRQALGTNVVDHTGMTGMYAYHFMYKPSSVTPQNEEDLFPDIADAVREQLGLELKPAKGPVTFWVVDHIERPTPN